jgi:hypothetical protein
MATRPTIHLMWGRRFTLLGLLVAFGLPLTVGESSASASESDKPVSYGGLTFQVPRPWPILKLGQTASCGSVPPAVVIWAQGSQAHAPSCLDTIAHGGTVLMLLAPAQTAGCPLPAKVAAGAQTQHTSSVRDGITVDLAVSHLTGKTFNGFPASSRIVWNVQACFTDFPKVALEAYSSGGHGEGSLTQAVAIANSVTLSKPR